MILPDLLVRHVGAVERPSHTSSDTAPLCPGVRQRFCWGELSQLAVLRPSAASPARVTSADEEMAKRWTHGPTEVMVLEMIPDAIMSTAALRLVAHGQSDHRGADNDHDEADDCSP